ncbi:replication initiator protein A [Deinococcus petrolearius]|uniref:Replication initiator protein A n=1 Tax=Deinococcus petrolearius TaxID=1751295 RepID=A0ABW1DL07_9DEIO
MTKIKNLELDYFTAERFVAQIGIVSIQSRIEEDSPLNRRWTSYSEVGDSIYTVEGYAADFGRPRGVDTDILMALETLFMCQGCPGNNTVTTTAYEIVQLVYRNTSGVLYKRLHESLLRLWRVGFMVSWGHNDPEGNLVRFANRSLSLIEAVQFWSQGKRRDSPDLAEIEAHGKLVIRFSEQLAGSIRAGYYQHLNRKLLTELEQPVARALYRILQAHRPPDGVLTCKVSHWGTRCGIIATDPRKIRRTLESAHDELRASGYLAGVEYTGRGANQEITYHYRAAGSADPHLVELLRSVGVAKPSAMQYAAEYPDRVETTVQYVKDRKGTRNKAGLAVDILLNPEKYDLPEALTTPVARAEDAKKATQQSQQAAEQAADAEFQARQAVLLALDPATQWENCCSTIRLLTKGVLAESGLTRLEALCRTGEVSAAELSRRLSASVSKAERSAFMQVFARQHTLTLIEDARRVSSG